MASEHSQHVATRVVSTSDELGRAPASVIKELSYVRHGHSPEPALHAAIALRDDITPRLLEELALAPVDVKARFEAEPDENTAYYLQTFAFFLLGLFEEKRAFPLMLDYFASDADLAEELSGEDLSGYLAAVLVRCYDGSDLRQLRLMIETSAYEPTFRHDCLQAYHGLALAGQIEKAEVVAFVSRLLDAIPTDATYDRWYPWLAMGAAELQAPELKARIVSLFDRGLTEQPNTIFPLIDKKGIDDIYGLAPERIREEILQHRFFANFVDRVCRWYWFQKPREHRDAATRAYDACQQDMPYMRTQPKLGRNDPCLCGSGKKYKKCCLN